MKLPPQYKPKYYYWTLVIVIRKLFLVTFALIFHSNATMQLSMILLVCFLAYTAQVKYNPYMSTQVRSQGLVLPGQLRGRGQPRSVGKKLKHRDVTSLLSSH